MHDRVIACVDDNTNIVGVNFKDEAAQKTSSADATSEDSNHSSIIPFQPLFHEVAIKID
jgi:hypothetical protein